MEEQTELQQVTIKDPKKVEERKRLAEYNCRKIEENAQMAKVQSEPKLTYYNTGAVVAIGALGILGYYVYQLKTPKETQLHQTNRTPVHQPKETLASKFEIE